jgi:hypothetical protein
MRRAHPGIDSSEPRREVRGMIRGGTSMSFNSPELIRVCHSGDLAAVKELVLCASALCVRIVAPVEARSRCC